MIHKIRCRLASCLLASLLFNCPLLAQTSDLPVGNWPFNVIETTTSSSPPLNVSSPVIVAVVDDAFRCSHKSIQDFLYKNPHEIPNNQYDDDGNGYVDDVHGWDISDQDKDVSAPAGRARTFFHGTYIASIITQVAQVHYGNKASQRIKIMPIKVLADQAQSTYLKDGYRGIEYAIDNGANMICLAWSGGFETKEHIALLEKAYKKGILVIGSAGNLNQEEVPPPASLAHVLAVSGVNESLQKMKKANYGTRIDLSAPAVQIKGGHPQKDNAFIEENGTSPATALVTGCAAVLWSQLADNAHPTLIKEALINTSQPFPTNFIYGGKMGAGIVQLAPAIDYVLNPKNLNRFFSSLRSKGTINYDKYSDSQIWNIQPAGTYHGYKIFTDISGIKKPQKHTLRIEVADTLWNVYPLSKLPPQLFIPVSHFRASISNRPLKKKEHVVLYYEGQAIDSSRLYCAGTRQLEALKGVISDGSDLASYSNDCSCKWLITLPPGMRIRFTFDQMDTQGNVDFVYLIDGSTVLSEHIFAKFSGQQLPPVVTSSANEVLIWFVTDGNGTGQGWQVRYEAVE